MRFCLISLAIVLPLAFFTMGCKIEDKPELDSSQYGELVSTLPEVEGKKATFELPEAVESGECQIAEQVRKERAASATAAQDGSQDKK